MYFCRIIKVYWGSRRDHMVIGCKTICAIINNIVSLNPAHGEVYSIHLKCDKVCHLLVVGRLFSRGTWVSSTNNSTRLRGGFRGGVPPKIEFFLDFLA